jgi:transposase
LVVVRVDWAKGGLKSDEYRFQCLSQLKKHPIRGRVPMQDGARIHWTSGNKEFIKKTLKMPVVDEWPPHSADMNPIEHMWGYRSTGSVCSWAVGG